VVSTAWLAEHLEDQNLVLLHVGDKAEFDAAHIPGAQFIALADISTPRGTGLALELPPVEQLHAAFEGFGVSDGSRIVLYFGKDWVTPTTRVFFTLDYLGLGERTSILDGGLPAWRADGRPVTADLRPRPRGSLTARARSSLVVDAEWVKSNVKKPEVSLVDARDAVFFAGEKPGGDPPLNGHIPGAVSLPFGSVMTDDNRFRDLTELAGLFGKAGVKPGKKVAAYCHIGQQATLVYFAARTLGYDAVLYDGSFQDWSARRGEVTR